MTTTWIRFEEVAPKKKTRVWLVMPKTCDTGLIPIGAVAWYGPWRKYAFYPAPQTLFEQVCLREIATFCEEATREHKAKKQIHQAPPPASGPSFDGDDVPPEHELRRAIDHLNELSRASDQIKLTHSTTPLWCTACGGQLEPDATGALCSRCNRS